MNESKGYQRLHTDDNESQSPNRPSPPYDSRFRNLSPHALIYAILIITNIATLTLWLRPHAEPVCIRPQLITSPAKDDDAIRYEKRRLFRKIENNVFTGDPRPEFDAAWRELIEPMTLKITAAELSPLPGTSIAFADNSGYIAEMAVYHELHCIRRLRRHFHLDRYYANMSDEEKVKEEIHIDHCLEYWREAAMCRGDTALTTFFWQDGMPYSHVYSDHECVDWERLDGWARGRMVNMSDYGILVGG